MLHSLLLLWRRRGVIYKNAHFAVANSTNITYAQGQVCSSSTLPQKNCTAIDLVLDVYFPVSTATAEATVRPAYILSHGGGNVGGSKEQYCFQGSAAFFASRGFVAFNIDYRLAGQHGTLPRRSPAPGPSPGPSPPFAGAPLVASSNAGEGMWWPHPTRHSARATAAKTTTLRYGDANGTLCITPTAAGLEAAVGTAAPLALELNGCGAPGSDAEKAQLWTTGTAWSVAPQRFIHKATGLCLTLLSEVVGGTVVATPCAAQRESATSDQTFQLGYSGRLFSSGAGQAQLSIVPNTGLHDGDGGGLLDWTPKWESGYPAVRDLKAAIRWVRANAARYNVDATRVVVSGGSAGATNSVAAGVTFDGDYRDELTAAEDPTLASTHLEQHDSVQCVVSHWSSDGEIDLVTEYDPAHATRFTKSAAPIIEFHGDLDSTINISHAKRVEAAFANIGVPYELHVLKGCGHGAWCYDENGTCACSDGTAGYSPLMDEIALPFVAETLGLTLG